MDEVLFQPVSANRRECPSCRTLRPSKSFYSADGQCGSCVKFWAQCELEDAADLALARKSDDPEDALIALRRGRQVARDRQRWLRQERAAAKEREARERVGSDWRLRRYGLSDAAIEKMLHAQRGRCLGCADDVTADTVFVDHDHACCPGGGRFTCGECVRGLLCSRCNSALGFARDDQRTLRALADYLDKYERRE